MRHWQGCITVPIALTPALTISAAPVAWADPPPLAQAEAAIGAENCGLPPSTPYAGRHTRGHRSPTTPATIVRAPHPRGFWLGRPRIGAAGGITVSMPLTGAIATWRRKQLAPRPSKRGPR